MHQQPLNPWRFSAPQGADPGPAESLGRVEQEAQSKVRVGGPQMPVDLETGGASTAGNDSEDSGSARSVESRGGAQNPVLAGPGSRGWLRWFRRLRLGETEGGRGRPEGGASPGGLRASALDAQTGDAGAPLACLLWLRVSSTLLPCFKTGFPVFVISVVSVYLFHTGPLSDRCCGCLFPLHGLLFHSLR